MACYQKNRVEICEVGRRNVADKPHCLQQMSLWSSKVVIFYHLRIFLRLQANSSLWLKRSLGFDCYMYYDGNSVNTRKEGVSEPFTVRTCACGFCKQRKKIPPRLSLDVTIYVILFRLPALKIMILKLAGHGLRGFHIKSVNMTLRWFRELNGLQCTELF